jgi:UrcA family protein
MFNLKLSAVLTAIVSCLAAGYASADAGKTDDVPKIVVSLAGLEMSSPKGAEMVYGRIRTAARTVCRVDQSRVPQQIARARVCFRNAMDDAVGQANRPALSALHAKRMGEPAEMIRSARR